MLLPPRGVEHFERWNRFTMVIGGPRVELLSAADVHEDVATAAGLIDFQRVVLTVLVAVAQNAARAHVVEPVLRGKLTPERFGDGLVDDPLAVLFQDPEFRLCIIRLLIAK
jgi:hypothetical protein